jgi:hypothetical protein
VCVTDYHSEFDDIKEGFYCDYGMTDAIKTIANRTDADALRYADEQGLEFDLVKDEGWLVQELAHWFYMWAVHAGIEDETMGRLIPMTVWRPDNIDPFLTQPDAE